MEPTYYVVFASFGKIMKVGKFKQPIKKKIGPFNLQELAVYIDGLTAGERGWITYIEEVYSVTKKED